MMERNFVERDWASHLQLERAKLAHSSSPSQLPPKKRANQISIHINPKPEPSSQLLSNKRRYQIDLIFPTTSCKIHQHVARVSQENGQSHSWDWQYWLFWGV